MRRFPRGVLRAEASPNDGRNGRFRLKRRSWLAAGCAFLAAGVFAVALVGRGLRADDPAAVPPPAQSADADDPAQRIQRALDQPHRLGGLADLPLSEVVQFIRDRHKIEVQIDRRALDEVGISPSTPISIEIKDVSLRSLLRLMLRPLELQFAVADDHLLITTAEAAGAIRRVKVYDVADLVTPTPAAGEGGAVDPWRVAPDFDSLITVITSCVYAYSWESVGGPGAVQPIECAGIRALVIAQTEEVHEEIAALLASLRAVRKGKPPVEFCPRPIAKASDAAVAASRGRLERNDPVREARQAKIREALAKKVSFEFDGAPLSDALRQIKSVAELPIHVDQAVAQARGNGDADDKQRLVTYRTKDRPLGRALAELLEPLELKAVVSDEVVVITTPEEADKAEVLLHTRVYDVSDLPAYRDDSDRPVPDFQGLIEVITSSVATSDWNSVGGWGSIESFPNGGVQALVVRHRWEVHEQIGELLAMIRRVRPRPVTKEDIMKLPRLSFDELPGLGGAPPEEKLPPDPLAPAAEPLTEAVPWQSLARTTNQAGCDLVAQLRKQQQGNLVFSPFSLHSAMALVYAGAKGRTADEIGRALGFAAAADKFHPTMRALADSFRQADASRSTELRIVNRLWVAQNATLLSEFQTLTRNYYGAEATAIDFSNPAAAAAAINAWAAQQTARRIDRVVGPEMIARDAPLIVTNAVYLKAAWEKPFKRHDTKTQPFFAYDGPVDVPLMKLAGEHRYVQFGNVQALEKPYADGRLSMVVFLPEAAREAMDRLEATLNAETLERLLDGMKSREVEVFLPRFRIEQQFDLVAALKAVGVRRAFEPGAAEFGGIGSGEAFLSGVVQKVFVDVSEEGTEAAAVTAGGFGGGMPMEPPKRVVFRADRPFLFLIRDCRSGSILFAGRFVRPDVPAAEAR